MTDDTERRARALALVRALRAGEHEEVRALMADAVPPLPPVRDETEDTWGHLLDLQRREEVQAIRASVKDLLVGLAALVSEHLEDVFGKDTDAYLEAELRSRPPDDPTPDEAP